VSALAKVGAGLMAFFRGTPDAHRWKVVLAYVAGFIVMVIVAKMAFESFMDKRYTMKAMTENGGGFELSPPAPPPAPPASFILPVSTAAGR